MKWQKTFVLILIISLTLLGAALAEQMEPEPRVSSTAEAVQVDGFGQAADVALKYEALAAGAGGDRKIEFRRVPLSVEEVQALKQAGKNAQIDLITREGVFQHITDYLPAGWGKITDSPQPIDSFGDSIVNQRPGIPGWSQGNVDALRRAIVNSLAVLSQRPAAQRAETESLLGNYIGQAVVRGIDIGDLVDLMAPEMTDDIESAIVTQLSFYESVKLLHAEDAGYRYEPTEYDDRVVAFVESLGSSLDEVLSIAETGNRMEKNAPSGCYNQSTFAAGMTALVAPNIIWNSTNHDDASADVPIGFSHYFYSCNDPDKNTEVRVSTNGYVTFHQQGDGALDGPDFTNDPITDSEDPDGFIAPAWDDYIIATAQGTPDQVSYLTEGALGSRVFTVEWRSVSHYLGDLDDFHWFQTKLFEATGNVELHFGLWQTDSIDSATVGMEDFSGLDGDCGLNCDNTNTNLDLFDNYLFEPNRPSNDLPSGSTCIAFDGAVNSNSFGATGENLSSCGGNDFKDTWFFFDAPGGNVTFDTCAGTAFDSTLSVFDDGLVTEVACNDDSCGFQSSVTVNLSPGTRYRVRLAGFAGQEGSYSLTATPDAVPTGDLCTNAWVVDSGISGFTTNNTGCVDQSSCGILDTIDEWLAWTAPATGTATATTCNVATNFDTTLAVFDGCGGAELNCNDDDFSCGANPFHSTISWPVTVGTTYFIRIAGFAETRGNYEMGVTVMEVPLFSDGFESGDVSGWSSSSP